MTNTILDVEQHTPQRERPINVENILKEAVIKELQNNTGALTNAVYSFLRSPVGKESFVTAVQSLIQEEILKNNSELLSFVKQGVTKELETIKTELKSNKYINSYLCTGLTSIIAEEFKKHNDVFREICQDVILKELVKEKAVQKLNSILEGVVSNAFYATYND